MENRLKKQLATIKSRALMLARRGTHPEGVAGPSPNETTTSGECSDAGSWRNRTDSPATTNPVIDDLLRAGAVARATELESSGYDASRRLRRGSWWWRRRLGSGPGARVVDPVARAARESGFEAQFQRVLQGLATGESLTIEDAVPGEACALEGSNYYLIRSIGADIDPVAPTEAAHFSALDSWPETVSRAMVGRFVRRGYAARDGRDIVTGFPGAIPLFRRVDPHSVLFLDIETAGLSANTYVFLCGLMYAHRESGAFHVEQVFARDYAEEAGLLMYVRAALSKFDTVVTYNGASFDMPFLRTRMAVHRVPDIVPMGSVDLLHATRRVYRPGLPNVRLVTVEKHLRGVERVDDIPSRFIPRAYHEYVRTRDARIMRNVVYHNRMDLFTMALILNRLASNPVDALPRPEGAEKAFAPAPSGDTMAPPNPPHVSSS
jgi:uncharacterized protein YprB with RNaseH-like and TPR domain